MLGERDETVSRGRGRAESTNRDVPKVTVLPAHQDMSGHRGPDAQTAPSRNVVVGSCARMIITDADRSLRRGGLTGA